MVGTTTAGFGYAQSRLDLSDGSVMVLSSLEYYTPEGVSLQEVGVSPDVKVSMNLDARYALLEEGKGEDLPLREAVAMLTE